MILIMHSGLASLPPVVSLTDSVVRAGDGRVLLRVDHLTVCAGDRIAVTGPSGAGKTVLLRLLSGRLAAGLSASGRRDTASERVAMVPQRGLDALHPLLPLGTQLRTVTRASAERVREVLAAVGLGDPRAARRRPAELSGGQAQRAAIALAVLSRAPLMLADEPTSALDHDTRDRVLDLFSTVIGTDQALVVSTHDETVADRLGAARIRVADGALVAA
ncbi:Glutamine transport ATP-binding protein GlnQ [Microbacterium sp. Bi128]|nr:Glutamine transport ATP-binding protein GlnQ [Microbacterium sp. Bi128]